MQVELENLRAEINNLDNSIIKNIKSRLDISKKIGKIKKQENLDVLDESREEELFKKYLEKSEELNLDSELIKKIFSLLTEESKKQQR